MNPVIKRSATALSVAAVAAWAILSVSSGWMKFWCCVLFLLCASEYSALLSKKIPSGAPGRRPAFWTGMAVLGFAFWMFPAIAKDYGNAFLLYTVAIVKFSDMGGFAFGIAFGKHKMCPSVSPNKSWEGLAGSLFASSLVSCLFMGLTHFSVAKSIGLGVAAALAGTFGDLLESKFKRWAGVKDSSTMAITNGMGGFLDMFDSLLFAPAFLYWLY